MAIENHNALGGFGSDSSTTTTRGDGVNGDSGSDANYTQYKAQIHVKGDFGTRTVRRTDSPDYGAAPVEGVVTFGGAVDFRSDCVVGVVSLGDGELDDFIGEIDGRVREYTVHTFEVDNDD